MSKQYLIAFNGSTRNGFDPLVVASRLARAMSKPDSYCDRLLNGTPTVLMRTTDFEAANEMALQIHSLGAHTRIVELRKPKNTRTETTESVTGPSVKPDICASIDYVARIKACTDKAFSLVSSMAGR